MPNEWFYWDYYLTPPIKTVSEFNEYVQRKRDEQFATNRDWVHAIIGEEGLGKSEHGLNMCTAYDPTFLENISDRLIYDVDSLENIEAEQIKRKAFLVDEAIFLSHSRAAMSNRGVRFVETIASIRYLNNLICLCIPRLSSLDPYLRDHRLRTVSWTVGQGKIWYFGKQNYPRICEWEGRFKLSKKKRPKVRPRPDFKFYPPALKKDSELLTMYESIRANRIKNRVNGRGGKVEAVRYNQLAKESGLSSQTIRRYFEKYSEDNPDHMLSLRTGEIRLKTQYISDFKAKYLGKVAVEV